MVGYADPMGFKDPKTFLWDNICRLAGMGEKPSIDDVKARVGVGRGTVQRIKEGIASTRLDSLTAIAERLRVPTWKLLQDSQAGDVEIGEPARNPTDVMDSLLTMLADVLDRADDRARARIAERMSTFMVAPDSRRALDALREALLSAAPPPSHTDAPAGRVRVGVTEGGHLGGMSHFGGLDDVAAPHLLVKKRGQR